MKRRLLVRPEGGGTKIEPANQADVEIGRERGRLEMLEDGILKLAPPERVVLLRREQR